MSETETQITLIPNGPIRIEEGTCVLTLSDGSTVTKEAPLSLCRCGQSGNKPFCDGTHNTVGFKG